MKVFSLILPLLLAFSLMGIASPDIVPPFYPPPKPLAPAASGSTTITPKEIRIPLPDGLTLTPGDFNETRSLNGTWKISGLESSETPFGKPTETDHRYQKADFDDSAWDNIPVPLDWYRQYPKFRSKTHPYVKATYRHRFEISPEEVANGKRVLLHFGVIGYDATIFVNGRRIGRHKGDFTPCEFDITKAIKVGENRLAIRVLTDFGPNRSNVPLATHVYGSQWGMDDIKGGLWQSVTLRFAPAIRFQQLLLNPTLSDDSLSIDYTLVNETGKEVNLKLGFAVSTALKDSPNQLNTSVNLGPISLKPGTNTGSAKIKLVRPHLWSPDDPFLYYLTGYLVDQKTEIISGKSQRFGFREFKIIDGKFHLNGSRIYLFGENFSSATYGGRTRTPEEEREHLRGRLARFKSLGINIIRPAHMPPIPAALEIADEMGLMIYNEWGWTFTHKIDEKAFQKNNTRELLEWLARDHNHPSVVAWAGGNEVIHKEKPDVKRQLDRQVDLIRKFDRQGRPVGSFSGSGSWISYGTDALNTDFVDLHDYAGFFRPSWTKFRSELDKNYQGTLEQYTGKKEGTLPFPYIIWECVGFSWGQHSDPEFKLNDIESYAKYARSPTSWGKPNGIGLAGTIGLAAALDPNRGLAYGRAKFGHRLLEQIRQDTRIDGFAPWFLSDTLLAATLWNQPIFPGIRNSAGLPPVNYFVGDTVESELFVVNSTDKPILNAEFHLWLQTPEGAEIEIERFPASPIEAWSLTTQAVRFIIPNVPSPYPQIRITLSNPDGTVLGQNFYNLGVRERSLLSKPLTIGSRIALLDTGDQTALDRTSTILKALEVPFDILPVSKISDKYQSAIIPPGSGEDSSAASSQSSLLSWVRAGGKLLILEQSASTRSLLPGLKSASSHLAYVDLAIPEHPVFAGLLQRDFDHWNNPDAGYVIDAGIEPFTTNAIAVRAPQLSSNKIENAVMEGTLGSGRIFWTQLNATKLWGIDSSASLYLRNVLDYMLGSGPAYAKVKPLPDIEKGKKALIPEGSEFFVNLTAHANQGFEEDGKKGGWTGAAGNDFPGMPTGLQNLKGVPFKIIDPIQNHGKSCLVLHGSDRTDLPVRIDGLPVNQKLKRLYFLHASAGNGDTVGRYRLHYEDGTHFDYLLVNGRNIGNWAAPSALPEAEPVIIRGNRKGNGLVGVYRTMMDNPHPEKKIVSIDFLSSAFDNSIEWLPGMAPIPILVGITGELEK